MATATPYRWGKSAPPGSTLCPYCEVVYAGGGNGTHCATCGTKLVILHTSLVAVESSPASAPVPMPLVRPERPEPPTFRQGFFSGFTRMARLRWLMPLWATILTIAAALTLDRLILPPHRLTSSTDIAPLLTLGSGRIAAFLALTAVVSFCGGLVLGRILRQLRFPAAVLGGSAIAFAHLSFTELTPTTFVVVLAHPFLWVCGALLMGRWLDRKSRLGRV
ncbi:MAG TPA: hypothetical protein VIL85_08145 [Thermomicrobiales bacterium]|jgi:hypothetical protein